MMNDASYKWEATEAYIMEGINSEIRIKDWKVDIGMAIISDQHDKRFFNRESLKIPDELEIAKRVPVCLPAKNYQVLGESLLGTGWGDDYEQTPSNKYSTCMSSEQGPEFWRFQNCEMKGSQTCEKNQPPPNNYDMVKCTKYFDKSGFNLDKKSMQHSPNDLALSPEVADVDVIYIKSKNKNGNEFTTERTCYQPKNLKHYGWCYLKRQQTTPGMEPWGICSPSCSTPASQSKARISTVYNILMDS